MMKKFTIVLLSAVFVALIACSVQSVTADHLEPGQGIYKDENDVNYVSTKDSKYQIHLQVEIRNAQGQLVSISEASHGKYIPHEITNFVFNEKLGKKEIITIGDIKYEKIQYADTFDMKQLEHTIEPTSGFLGYTNVNLCGEIGGHAFSCVAVFQTNTELGVITGTDVITNQWTILRDMN